MTYRLDTNLAELPLNVLNQLSSCLNQNDTWFKVLDSDRKNAFYSSNEEVEKVRSGTDPGKAILQRWGNRGQNVRDLIVRLQWLAHVQGFGAACDRPQLVLRRKFKPVRWALETMPIRISPHEERQEIVLKALAVGFPSPHVEWLRDGESYGSENVLRLNKCKCEANFSYVCRVWNEVDDGQPYSDFYRVEGKQFSSQLLSEPIDLSSIVQGTHACDRCKAAELEKIREKLGGSRLEGTTDTVPSSQVSESCEHLVAADKVALIISNCAYHHLPPLHTPNCDAETLAVALQAHHFKTVTLADLTLDEMRFMISEYKKLLGNDVYAVLYFAGHGFEVNGQCYLLPVEAPLEAHEPGYALSMDWVLGELHTRDAALNLILLDVCRKYVPLENVPLFIEEAVQLKKRHRANRNTVYGFSTSGGVGAYEVRGEVNGVFMSALKKHINQNVPVPEMLRRVSRDIEQNPKVEKVQFPEIRSTLTLQRKLGDELMVDGHTASYDMHNALWFTMHEMPSPKYVRFEAAQVTVTVWADGVGCFTNKAYVFSSVSQMRNTDDEEETAEGCERAAGYLALLEFPEELEAGGPRLITDEEEGISLRYILSHLQKSKGPVKCTVKLTEKESQKVIATEETVLGHVRITRLTELENN